MRVSHKEMVIEWLRRAEIENAKMNDTYMTHVSNGIVAEKLNKEALSMLRADLYVFEIGKG